MPSIAITGGIACGKSTATHFLAKTLETMPFSADQEVALLLEEDQEVATQLKALFGASLYTLAGKIDKNYLRERLLEDNNSKNHIEAILHPLLKKKWLPQARAALGSTSSLFLAEIPLLFENDLAPHFDHVIVVAASAQKQLDRLIQDRHLPYKTACSLLRLQLPLLEKIERADEVVWNDGSKTVLEKQLDLVVTSLRRF